MIFNPYVMLAAVVLYGASILGSYFYGRSNGADSEIATQAREDHIADVAFKAAQNGAAEAISGIKIKNTIIRQRVESEIREKPIYTNGTCVHSDNVLRDINAALTGDQLADDSKLPAAVAPH